MSIIEEADEFKWKEIGEQIKEGAKKVGMPDIDLKFVEVLRYFGIDSADKMNKETIEKIKTIYESFKDSEDILKDIRELDSKLGNPIILKEKLDKIYSYIYSQNLEKGFQKEKEIRDQRTVEMIERGRKEKEEIIKTREKEERAEKKETLLKAQKLEKEKRKEQYLKGKKEKEVEERIKLIEKTKPPKLPEIPKIKI